MRGIDLLGRLGGCVVSVAAAVSLLLATGPAAIADGGTYNPDSVAVADMLSGDLNSQPQQASASFDSAAGVTLVAGTVAISIPPGAVAAPGTATVTVTPSSFAGTPVGLRAPGGPPVFSPNGTVFDVQIVDANGDRVTVFPTPITMILRYNYADLAVARGRTSTLSAAFETNRHTSSLANPMGFPSGSWVFFPASSVAVDGSAGTMTISAQAIGASVGVFSDPKGYVQSYVHGAGLYSSFDPSTAKLFGVTPQFSYFRVLEPQVGSRLLVRDYDTNGLAYVNAADVGPAGPPAGATYANRVSNFTEWAKKQSAANRAVAFHETVSQAELTSTINRQLGKGAAKLPLSNVRVEIQTGQVHMSAQASVGPLSLPMNLQAVPTVVGGAAKLSVTSIGLGLIPLPGPLRDAVVSAISTKILPGLPLNFTTFSAAPGQLVLAGNVIPANQLTS